MAEKHELKGQAAASAAHLTSWKWKHIQNFCYFHRKRIFVNATIIGFFGMLAFKYKNSENDCVRMMLGGGISHVAVEASFHMFDTINIRSKANSHLGTSSMLSLTKKIYSKEGIFGFYKGFSACLYGSLFAGLTYFYFYKFFKNKISNHFDNKLDITWVAMPASFIAELITLCVYYPYDTIKCRLQSVNSQFKYKTIPHAFTTEINKNGPKSLYIGMTPFIITVCTFVMLQFTI